MSTVNTNCTVIIPTKNRHDLLVACVDSLLHYNPAVLTSIVIVDTGDGEDCGWAIQKGYRAFHTPGATFAQANNEAARRYPSPHLVLLNNDCFLLSRLSFHSHGITGALLLYPNGLVQHAGIGFDTDGGGYNLWKMAPSEHPEVCKRRYLPAVTFACATVPLQTWRGLGGLDEGYINSYEDVDFCLRAKELGIPIIYDPAMTAEHLEGQTEGRDDLVHLQRSWEHYYNTWVVTGRVYYALGSWPFSRMQK